MNEITSPIIVLHFQLKINQEFILFIIDFKVNFLYLQKYFHNSQIKIVDHFINLKDQ